MPAARSQYAITKPRRLIITVHGIRTFGAWQERLERIATEKIGKGNVMFANYRYGFFSVILFIIPFMRWLAVRGFQRELTALTARERWTRIDLVGHSFGTHLLMWALRRLPKEKRPAIHTVLLAGSVLKTRFRWSDLDGDVRRVVNDCGIVDTVLLWNQLLVYGTGMAGRVGFVGTTHNAFRDRFHLFGHSGYFIYRSGKPKDRWMAKYWLPVLLQEEDGEIAPHDARRPLSLVQGALHTASLYMEPIKLALLLALPTALLLYVAGLYVKADRERLIAEAQSSRNKSLLLSSQARDLLGVKDERALLSAVEATKATAKQGYVTSAARDALQSALGRVTGVALVGHQHSIRVAEFSADERLLATSSDDPSRNFRNGLRIWDIANPKSPKVRHIIPSNASTYWMVFDRAGDHILVLQRFLEPAFSDNRQSQAWVWSLTEGQLYPSAAARRSLFSPQLDVDAVAPSTNSDVLAVARPSGEVVLVSLANLSQTKVLRELRPPFPDRIARLVLSRDNRVLLACTESSHVWVWNLESRSAEPVADINAKHRAEGPIARELRVDICGINDDHTVLYTASSQAVGDLIRPDLDLKLWRLEKLSPVGDPLVLSHRGAPNSSAIEMAKFSSDGKSLMTMSRDGWVRAWRITSGKEKLEADLAGEHKLGKFADYVSADPDRSLVAFAYDNEVRVLRIGALALGGSRVASFSLPGFDGRVSAVHFSRAGGYLFAAGGGGGGRLWDLRRDDPVAPVPSSEPSPYEPALAASLLGGGSAAMTVRDTAVEFWSLRDPYRPKLMRSYPFDPTQARTKDCPSCAVSSSPDVSWAAVPSAAKDETDKMDVVELMKDGRAFKVGGRSFGLGEVEFSHDGRWLFAQEKNKQVVFDLRTAAPELPKRIDFEMPSGSYRRALSPDGKSVLFMRYVNKYEEPVGREHTVGFFWPLGGEISPAARINIDGFAYGIARAVYSPDGRWLALAGEMSFPNRADDDTVVRLIRLGDSQLLPIDLTGHEYAQDLSFSGDGRWLLTASHDITLTDRRTLARLWRLDHAKGEAKPYILPGIARYLHGSRFSRDGRFLVTISGGGPAAHLWRLDGSEVTLAARLAIPRQTYNWHWDIVFDSRSTVVVIANRDNPTPYLWRLDQPNIPERGLPIAQGDGTIESIQFIDNDKKIMIRSLGLSRSYISIVDLETFPEEDSVYRVEEVSPPVRAATYRGDVGLLLTSGTSLRARVISLKEAVERAKLALGRSMSLEEWAQTGVRDAYRPTFPDLVVDGRTLASLVGVAALARPKNAAAASELGEAVVAWTVRLNDADVCDHVGWEFALQADGKNALAAVSCALKHAPDNPSYRDTRGVALALLGRKQEAIADLRFFVAAFASDTIYAESVATRRRWIEALEAGRNPFVNGLQ